VYVPNSVSNTLDVIDPATYRVIATYPVGSQPQHVTPSWDMSTLYVDNDVSDSVTPIDARTGKPGKEFHMRDPYNLYFTPDGTKAITVAERRHAVDFRDGPTLTFIKSLHIPYTGPNHLDFDAAGRFFFISCEFSGWLARVDVKSMAITGAIYLGGKPTDVRLSPDGTVFFVANERRNGVSVVDPVQMREIQFIPTGKGTHGFVVSRDGKSLYASNRLDGSVSVISFARREVVATWHFGGSPDMGGVSVDGSKLWLSGRYNHDVYVIDTFTGKLLQKIQVGRGPHGVCVFPQPGRYGMGHTGNYR
jgi:YVTN family beta-propeller protein